MNLVKQIWKDRKSKVINPVAFSSLAQRMAKAISDEGGGKKGRKNQSSQLRKHYDVIFNLNQRAKLSELNWNVILATLHKQLALIHYAHGRNLVTSSFVSMMDELIETIKDPDDLQVVTDFLEAFMAYYKEERPQN